MVNVCTYNPVATEHHTKYHDMSPQFKKSIFLKKVSVHTLCWWSCTPQGGRSANFAPSPRGSCLTCSISSRRPRRNWEKKGNGAKDVRDMLAQNTNTDN